MSNGSGICREGAEEDDEEGWNDLPGELGDLFSNVLLHPANTATVGAMTPFSNDNAFSSNSSIIRKFWKKVLNICNFGEFYTNLI